MCCIGNGGGLNGSCVLFDFNLIVIVFFKLIIKLKLGDDEMEEMNEKFMVIMLCCDLVNGFVVGFVVVFVGLILLGCMINEVFGC